ncbi:MAG: aldo/keto reductase [Planctomycetota bacterium]
MITADTNTRTFRIGGQLEVSRVGYGAMRLTGQPSNFGPYPEWEDGVSLVRRAVDLGVDFFDTALPYGPGHSERLLAEALSGREAVIATKGGVDKPAPGNIITDGRPATLRNHVDRSLASLKSDRIDLYQLHRVDPDVPLQDSIGELARLRDEGKLRFLGLSNVNIEQYELAKTVTTIESVQNRFNVIERSSEALVRAAASDGAAFIPYGPLGAHPMKHGAPLAQDDGPLAAIAARHGVNAGQIALAWLLHIAPNTIVIPATTKVAHLELNVEAMSVRLSDSDMNTLSSLSESAR